MKDNIIQFRKSQLREVDKNNILSTIRSIELSICNNCTQTCWFCPMSNLDKKDLINKKMSIDTIHYIKKHLQEINFRGRLGLSGFGEPLLNENLLEIISELKDCCSSMDIVTNGDLLNPHLLKELEKTTVKLLISVHKKHKEKELKELLNNNNFPEDKYILRKHYTDDDEHMELDLTNRAGNIGKPLSEPKCQPCYYPFYKLFIDWNGGYILCCGDWKNYTKRFELNVKDMSIKDFWLSDYMEFYRKKLMNNDRNFIPCVHCDIDGMVIGEDSFNMFKEYYDRKTTLE